MENIAAARMTSAPALAMRIIEKKRVRLSQRGVFIFLSSVEGEV
jgi:hypothetical protein